MATNNGRCGRVSLSIGTKRRLWSESAGYCQNPACAEYLFAADGEADFGEMAHIVAATTGGPRDVPTTEFSDRMRADHSNIALLCANCHTIVDKAPDNYPADMMIVWKARSQDKGLQVFGTPEYKTRSEARDYVEALLSENRTIFNRYGPLPDEFSEERAAQWRRHAVQTIVPNNAAIRRFLKLNRRLLSPDERAVADEFSMHSMEFEARHVLGEWGGMTQRFPVGMDSLFGGDA